MIVVFACVLGIVGAQRSAAAPQQHCATSSGRTPAAAAPAEVGFDAAQLHAAITMAAGRDRLNIQVFRNNCLVAAGPQNQLTGATPWNLWSSTKSVVSTVVGIAYSEGRIGLDDPVGKYLAPGLGDARHRAITVRNLLTETAGLQVAAASEGVTGVLPLDPDVVAQAMGLPILYPPGTQFLYSQRAVDLLAAVVQLAVGEEFQAYAQRKLFDPLGIPRSDYYWGRDRSGNTYGYAHLLLPPDDFAKIGLLWGNDGVWNGNRIVAADYLRQAREPSRTNVCYGFLVWLNQPGCLQSFGGLPHDAYMMSGAMAQDNFVVPSLGLVVSWTGWTGATSVTLAHDFLRAVAGALRDPVVADPGPYVAPVSPAVDDSSYSTPDVVLGAFGIGPAAFPGCNVFACLGRNLALPFADWPPGCMILACIRLGPGTPGIR